MGSVKNLTVEKEATEEAMGIGVFEFTDDYSVFDYGKMPDTLPGKGEALCRQAAYNFKELEKKFDIKTHFKKLVSGTKMRVNLVRVLMPQDNQIFEETKNYLVPLEIIFRNSLPKGSSVFKRLEDGSLTPDDLGLEEMPQSGHKFENAFVDVSTKLEPTDRYLSWDEAMDMAQISEDQLYELKEAALNINDFITEKAESIGLEHADGKVEFGLGPKNELILVDVCGTLDEDRFLWNGIHMSKQVARDYYKTTPWAKELEDAKNNGVEKVNWPAPEPLPSDLKEIISNMYKSVCEAWTGEKPFKAPSIEETMNSYKAFLEKNQ
ncbi:MAG: phosphoribosylaminoimidazolesuccinocarboxamide synthase [Candidatus Diapherotrites archaeon]|uniref:phosphoribosylaminoimidazolesuccinocarboxamide synthase n=1 Tax=Candidatus Iainarchaeum sp. TaxID=3101447 RepID=A0A2D6LNV4_9ARCH|nr:phosphoribosylaminoimidazolesuccinocarboxamide synthase [Candidatus Diapherotrites archaeon]|tara:strand:+ start:11917 stop:12882 length:966 start_codon:yes stop_codon:yes gene_type:complete